MIKDEGEVLNFPGYLSRRGAKVDERCGNPVQRDQGLDTCMVLVLIEKKAYGKKMQ